MLEKVSKFAYAVHVKETSSENVIYNLQLQFKTYLQSLVHSMGSLSSHNWTRPETWCERESSWPKTFNEVENISWKVDWRRSRIDPPRILPENKVEGMKTSGRGGKKCLPKLLLDLKGEWRLIFTRYPILSRSSANPILQVALFSYSFGLRRRHATPPLALPT